MVYASRDLAEGSPMPSVEISSSMMVGSIPQRGAPEEVMAIFPTGHNNFVNQTICDGKTCDRVYKEFAGCCALRVPRRDHYGDVVGGIRSSVAVDWGSGRSPISVCID